MMERDPIDDAAAALPLLEPPPGLDEAVFAAVRPLPRRSPWLARSVAGVGALAMAAAAALWLRPVVDAPPAASVLVPRGVDGAGAPPTVHLTVLVADGAQARRLGDGPLSVGDTLVFHVDVDPPVPVVVTRFPGASRVYSGPADPGGLRDARGMVGWTLEASDGPSEFVALAAPVGAEVPAEVAASPGCSVATALGLGCSVIRVEAAR
jgi:hypothetical protein